MKKFNFEEEIINIQNYLKTEYQNIVENFITEMFSNSITLEELKLIKINDLKFKNYTLKKINNTLRIELGSGFIELSYALDNSKSVKKINKEEYELTPIDKDSLIDICYVEEDKTILYTSKNKEMHLKKDNNKGLYSPILKEWTFTKKINDDFYDKYIYINHPMPQFHFIKENYDKSLYKIIYISQKENFGLEYFENKNKNSGKVEENTYISTNGLLKIK